MDPEVCLADPLLSQEPLSRTWATPMRLPPIEALACMPNASWPAAAPSVPPLAWQHETRGPSSTATGANAETLYSRMYADEPEWCPAPLASPARDLCLPEPASGRGGAAYFSGLYDGGEGLCSEPATAAAAGLCSTGTALTHGAPALFSSMYGDEASMCLAPTAASTPEAAAPRTGLSSYQPVPDDFVGPLAPNQIRQSQYDDLRAYNFDQFNVVADDFVGPLAPTQLRQAEYARLQSAWLNIAQGQGMAMSGTPADQATFRRMLRDGMTDSPVFRSLISGIGNDADPAHRIKAAVGRSQPGVVGDSFGDNAIDLDDLEAWPAAAPAAHRNQFTRNEDILHFLAERQYALSHPDPGGNRFAVFDDAHESGIDVQNQYRAERGQSYVLSQTGSTDAAGRVVAGQVAFADGSAENWTLNRGRITGITPP